MRVKIISAIALVTILVVGAASAASQGPDQPSAATPLSPDSLITLDGKKEGLRAPRAAGPTASGIGPGELELVSIIVTFDPPFDAQAVTAASGGRIIHRYRRVFNGVSMVVTGDKIATVASLPGVTAVYLDEVRQIDTERSPDFIGAPAVWDELGGQESAGEGVIVGVLDTGIWPEHPSFADPDPSGRPYDPPPGGPYFCDFGNAAWNPADAPFTCNGKVIGAHSFIDTYKTVVGLDPAEFDSARDANGHGTHTSSTAAGNAGVEASIFGLSHGTVSGIAPRAHVIMYRVCAGPAGSCYVSDSVAAIEQAIDDGVDVINFSIGGGGSPYSDAVSLAFLSAYENDIFVSCSAGNSGPGADTVGHREPWVTTVGASTTDRAFMSTVSLEADSGDTLTLSGASVTDGVSTSTPVVFPPVGEELCLTPFPAGTFSGEIVICERGTIARVAKSYNVAAGGAGGMLLYNPELQGLATDNHFIPSVHLEYDVGSALLDFMATHTGVEATFTAGTATMIQGDVMAAFSSRGGPGQTLGVSKPDITAPGVQILAGHTPLPAFVEGGLPGELFQSIQGTSMSAPHIAGAAALLSDLHPDWTVGQIKSALMTTAWTDGVVKEDGVTPADPFDYGSGRVDLNEAGDARMTISATAQDFMDHQDDLWNANLPSLYVPVMPGRITVQRTVHSQRGANPQRFADSPADVSVAARRTGVTPGDSRGVFDVTYDITVDARDVPLGEVRHATLYFRHNQEVHQFPVTLVRNQPVVALDKTCDPGEFVLGDTTECTVTIANTSFLSASVKLLDKLPNKLVLTAGSVVGADQIGRRRLGFDGILFGAEPPEVTVVDGTGTTPGYLPLSGFGIAPIDGVGDETLVNFSTNPFVYAGQTYTSIGMVSNGYAVVGGGDSADINYFNQIFPDPARPNNVLAPFWTDLNPSAEGELRAAYLGDGVNTWLVLDWEGVQNYGDGLPNSFQLWIGVNGVEDISFTYGVVSAGDGGWLTVGAENEYGNSGQNWYANGDGTLVVAGDEVRVTSVPGSPGETHTITFTMKGLDAGEWKNCANMTSDLFSGTNIACFEGEIIE